jgi:aryl-alcohol dehydrogenase-like predicted oxidoreductase
MTYRRVGKRSGLKVSRIGLGGWITYGKQVNYETCVSCVKTGVDLGINYFESSESYADGGCETDMGRAIKELGYRRADLVVASKVFFGAGHLGPNDLGLSRKHVIEGAEASIDRMGLKYLDIIIAHRADLETPIEETVRAFNYLIDSGKIMYWGVSEVGWQRIRDETTSAYRNMDSTFDSGQRLRRPKQYS